MALLKLDSSLTRNWLSGLIQQTLLRSLLLSLEPWRLDSLLWQLMRTIQLTMSQRLWRTVVLMESSSLQLLLMDQMRKELMFSMRSYQNLESSEMVMSSAQLHSQNSNMLSIPDRRLLEELPNLRRTCSIQRKPGPILESQEHLKNKLLLSATKEEARSPHLLNHNSSKKLRRFSTLTWAAETNSFQSSFPFLSNTHWHSPVFSLQLRVRESFSSHLHIAWMISLTLSQARTQACSFVILTYTKLRSQTIKLRKSKNGQTQLKTWSLEQQTEHPHQDHLSSLRHLQTAWTTTCNENLIITLIS